MRQTIRQVARRILTLAVVGSLVACGSSQTTEELIQTLQQRDSGAFSAAIELGSREEPEAVAALIAALDYDDAKLRKGALMGLNDIDDPKAVQGIILALQDSDSEVREEATRSLDFIIGQGYDSIEPAIAQLKKEDPKAIEPLVTSLKQMFAEEKSPYNQVKFVAVLGYTQDDSALEPIRTAINSEEEDVRQKAVEALGNFKSDRAVEVLLELSESSDESLRLSAVKTLGNFEGDRAIAALLEIFKKNEGELQKAAGISLAQTQNAKALDGLIAALNEEQTQESATIALGHSKDKRAIAELGKILQDPESSLKSQAATALAKIGSPALDILLPALKKDDPRIKIQVASALGEIGDPKAIEPLKANLTDWFSNQATAEALEQLDWNPKSERDSIHFLVAQRQGAQLEQQWETTKTVLLEDVGSGNSEAIQNALFAFIGLGKEEVISTLIEKLNNQGNKEMALVYLNCGHSQLEDAAKAWAQKNGYRVYSQPGVQRDVTWGKL